jgi:AAA domain
VIENLPDRNSFRKVKNKKQGTNPNDAFLQWLNDKVTREQQKFLYKEWVQRIKDQLLPEFQDSLAHFLKTQQELENIRNKEALRCLRRANIVGMTSSGLARNLQLLQKLQCKVVLVEEAGELLESHSIISLLPSIEHAIFIGEHLQLRPRINSYDLRRKSRLGSEYSLDKSLFERLVAPREGIRAVKVPFTTLETQRRMDPSISRLIRDELYPALKDGSSVQDYPDVHGMKKRLFWLDHTELEASVEEDQNTTTYWNNYEIDMTIALVSHLIKQGTYNKPEDLAVITPYLGQHLPERDLRLVYFSAAAEPPRHMSRSGEIS